MVERLRLPLSCALALAGAAACQTVPPQPPGTPRPTVVVEEAEAWRAVASPRHSAALDALAAQWDRALAATRAAGLGRRAASEGPLLDRSAALPRGAPPPGSYRCRFVRLGTKRWSASAQGFCYVTVVAGQLSLATELRGLRLGGYLWEPKAGDRLVFLGAAVPAGGKTAPAYRGDAPDDVAGVVDRIGEFRYRLALPEPGAGHDFTVVELVAAPRT